MALTIDWPNKIISIPRNDLQLVQSTPTEIRSLDLDQFHSDLRDLEDDSDGMPWPRTHSYVGPVTVGGVQLAPVVEIVNDYTITFEDGQYAVNLVGANSNVGDRVNVNQVSIRSANSAGLTFSDEINSQSYTGGLIWINSQEGLAGFAFPQGTPKAPVNNIADALLVKEREKLNSFNVENLLVIPSGTDLSNLDFHGHNPINDILVLQGGDTTYLNLESLTVTGVANGRIFIKSDCIVSNISNFSGGIVNSLIDGTLTVDATFTDQITIAKSGSAVAGTGKPTLDMNGANSSIICRDYSGSILLRNFNQGSNASFDFLSGNLYLDSTSTSGTIVVRGNAKVVDDDTGDIIKSGTWNGLTIVNHTTNELVWENSVALSVPKYLGLT